MTADTQQLNEGDRSIPALNGGGSPFRPVEAVLRFFSSVWLGVCLLAFLFVYCTIGSIGVWLPGYLNLAADRDWVHEIYWIIPWTQLHIRQAPGVELTEFEWFHTWVFNLNILLICVNLIVATLRRIPLNVVNLGVWMIHAGIIILCIGSVVYFATKLEGDAPIVRRQLVIAVPDHPPVSIAAQPGARKSIVAGNRDYTFEIMNIDPEWEMLSGEAAGRRTYAVMVAVHSPEYQFVRTLPAGYPQHIQDAIWTGDPEQPMVRAINQIGREIVDDSIELSLEYAPAERFYLMDSAAIYLREKGSTQWIERPVSGLPRYNDYIMSTAEIWPPRDDGEHPAAQQRALNIAVGAASPDDPLAEVPIAVTRYLRYAFDETRRRPGGPRLDPVVQVQLRSARGNVQHHELLANDPSLNTAENGRLAFRWVNSNQELEAAMRIEPAQLHIAVPDAGVEIDVPARPALSEDDSFIAIEGTDYAYRVESLQDNFSLRAGGNVSVAIVQIRTPQRTFQRWVFDRAEVAGRDFALAEAATGEHEREVEFDSGIRMRYRPGYRPAPVTILAGPNEDQLSLLLSVGQSEPQLQLLRPRQPVDLQAGISLEVLNYAARSWPETRPRVIAPEQRERNAGQQRSMIRVELPISGVNPVWLPYHVYPFDQIDNAMRRFAYQPKEVILPDGRVIEIMYSRQSRPLPTRIALHEFIVSSHIGGFTGQTSSIRDWTSMIRFDKDGRWTEPEPVSMNKPANYGGFWYFQAKWDPPDRPRWEGDAASAGLNYTVLGVGNRNGVWTQLFGCVLSVIGMCYAFYIKPIIKRRRQEAVYKNLDSREANMLEEGR